MPISRRPSAEHNQRVKDDWDVLAHYYDSRHGDAGNDWHRNLVLPTTLKLLGDIQGKRGIDLCCGSGVLARQLVELGAQVTGTDQSEEFLSLAEQYRSSEEIEWLCFPLADIAEHIEPSSFDFVTCTMALMDIPASEDLFAAIAHCLKPGGVAVVVTMHPVFKNPSNLQYTIRGRDGGRRPTGGNPHLPLPHTDGPRSGRNARSTPKAAQLPSEGPSPTS